MRITHTIIIMFIGSFLIHYFLMSLIMVENRRDITNSIGKAYAAIIMGVYMVFLEIMMHDHQYSIVSTSFYIGLTALLVLFIYLYRKQIAVNDKQYLEGMIEHHSMALLASKEILKKTDDYNVAKLAKNIIEAQENEIKIMRDLLNK